MRDILELCIRLDEAAHRTYVVMSDACDSPELSLFFRQMSVDENQHISWWSELLAAWEQGLLPDIADEQEMRDRLSEIAADIDTVMPQDVARLDADHMLELAAEMEFFMLDPVFGELTMLMQPGGRVDTAEAYNRHVLHLVDAIERYYGGGSLAALLASMLKRAFRDQQRLSALAMRDQLTELYNRRGLMGYLNHWLSYSERYGHAVSVALVDIDRFKAINDMFGHPVGDAALVAVSRALEGAVRASDMVGRLGGDEFLVLAPEADESELRVLMDRIREAVETTIIDANGEPLHLSVSLGGSYSPGGVSVSPEAIIAAADRSLYAAKAAGRNRAGDPIAAFDSVHT